MSILSNNRFLQRVNPEIERARTDAGASFVSDHAVIQPLMRQMVDLGIASNLKLWVHSGLVNTRTSGSDLFVPKAYDISGEENDAAQATLANQPKLVSNGMEFVPNDFLEITEQGGLSAFSEFSMSAWIYLKPVFGACYVYCRNQNDDGNPDMGILLRTATGDASFRMWANNTSANIGEDGFAWTDHLEEWVFIAMTWNDNLSTNNSKGFINGTQTNNEAHVDGPLDASSANNIRIGARHRDLYFRGLINDVRILNKALSASEISAIYNATKGYYGIT